MPDGLEFSRDFLPDAELMGAIRSGFATAEKATLLQRLHHRVEANRAAIRKQAREFDQMYEEAAHRLPTKGLVQLAERVRQSEVGATELLAPWLDALRQALTPGREASGASDLRELIEISGVWLALYEKLRTRLLTLAAERGGTESEVLRARPVEGEIDHAALSREFIARFPKIRAALAK